MFERAGVAFSHVTGSTLIASATAKRQELARGGMDLTPYYPFEEDIRHFHAT